MLPACNALLPLWGRVWEKKRAKLRTFSKVPSLWLLSHNLSIRMAPRKKEFFAPPVLPSLGNIGMAGSNAIAARVKDERLPIVVLVLLDLTHKDDVITAVVLANFSTDELSYDIAENR